MPIIRHALWRHYKGGLYTISAIAKREGTLTPTVVYQCAGTGQVWVQDAVRFFSRLECGKRRFEPLLPPASDTARGD